jgi:hypothetical protein
MVRTYDEENPSDYVVYIPQITSVHPSDYECTSSVHAPQITSVQTSVHAPQITSVQKYTCIKQQ